MDDLKAQIAQLTENANRLTAEKIAIDQCYGNALRENIQLRTELLITQANVQQRDQKIDELNKKIVELENKHLPKSDKKK